MVKLDCDLLIAKIGFYLVPPQSTEWFSFLVNSEGVFLFINPAQFAILWPWTKV